MVGSKKKHKSRRQRHTKTQEVFGVPTRRKKSKKRRKKKKKNLSPPYFYIVSVVVVVVVVVVDSFFLSAFERERRRRERQRKERVLSWPFFSQSFQVRSCKVIVRLSLLRWRRISLEFRNRFLFSPI